MSTDLTSALARLAGDGAGDGVVIDLARAPRRRRTAPAAVAPAPPAGGRGVDWALVRALREAAAKALAETIADGADDDERERGGRIVDDLLMDYARDRSAGREAGGGAGSGELAALRRAVLDALFGLGRLQPLVDDPEVENIEVRGYDDVQVRYADGRIERGARVADSDEELLETIAFIAARSQASERPFDRANPSLEFTLDGGARLSAAGWFSPRPYVCIRRHRLKLDTLADLMGRGMLGPDVHDFLARAVRAGKSVVVAGPQGAGKTTLVRALCAEMDPDECIVTIETEHELHLHDPALRDRHRRVFAFETRPGGGEHRADGGRVGEITLEDITRLAWRYNADRIIVGEVRGAEIMTMFNAMGGGAGSLCTVHASSAAVAVDRMVTLAMLAGAHVTVEQVRRNIAGLIDFIVVIGVDVRDDGDGRRRRHRYVAQIAAVGRADDGGPSLTDLWAAPRGTAAARPVLMPAEIAADLGLRP